MSRDVDLGFMRWQLVDALHARWARWLASGTDPWDESPKPKETWHVIERARLVELLRRAHEGEDPDLLYVEEYVNAGRDEVGTND